MGKINDLKESALSSLRGKWASFVGLTFVFLLLSTLAGFGTNYGGTMFGTSFATLGLILAGVGVIATIIMIPIQYGYVIAHLRSSRQDLPAEVGDLFIGFKNFWKVLGAMLLVTLIVFCGFLLLIVPGIILALAYTLVPYILHDNPELSITETLAKSRAMMKGHKWDLFLLMISFIGWLLLGILTFFIGYLWLVPYMQMTEYKFYEQIRAAYNNPTDDCAPVEDVETPSV